MEDTAQGTQCWLRRPGRPPRGMWCLAQLSLRAGRAFWTEGTRQSMAKRLLAVYLVPALTPPPLPWAGGNSPFFTVCPSQQSPVVAPNSLISCPSYPPHSRGPAWNAWTLWNAFQFPSWIPPLPSKTVPDSRASQSSTAALLWSLQYAPLRFPGRGEGVGWVGGFTSGRVCNALS